jgi:winged helix DNA-binding protein
VSAPLDLTRAEILAFRRRTNVLDERLPAGGESLRRAAWAGLQDSMPRAAVLSLHARVEGIESESWADPSLVQLWGPRYQVYAVAADDLAVFSLGRLPDDAPGRQRAERMAKILEEHLGGARASYSAAGEAIGVHPNALRYGATTGRVVIRWEGARRPQVWTVPRPEVDPLEARRELARRYVQVFGPGTAPAFAKWAGISARGAAVAFASLERELTPVRTPLGDAWILTVDEAEVRAEPGVPAPARLLPSGDAYYLLWGEERSLLVADGVQRDELWTSRVWPGAILVAGEVRGTWRRAHDVVTAQQWGRFAREEREAVEREASSLPLPGLERRIVVRWE